MSALIENLTEDCARVTAELVALGALVTSGYRDETAQAHAMATNMLTPSPSFPHGNRQWIAHTYKFGAPVQAEVDAHPDWTTVDQLAAGLLAYMQAHPDDTARLSHHLRCPCPCVDLHPMDETTEDGARVKARILAYQRDGIITQVLWTEGGLPRWHIEVGLLPQTMNLIEV